MKKILLSVLALLALAGSGTAQTLPSYVPANGLVGWWPFNGNANDESGNGHNGIVNGAVLTNDRFGSPNKSFVFNRNNTDHIRINNSLNLSPGNYNKYSISFWFNPTNTEILGQRLIQIIDKNLGNISNYDLLLSETGAAGKFCVFNYPQAPVVSSPDNWADST